MGAYFCHLTKPARQCLLSLALLVSTFAVYFRGPALFLPIIWSRAGAGLLVVATVTLVMTALTDPGIVPRVSFVHVTINLIYSSI